MLLYARLIWTSKSYAASWDDVVSMLPGESGARSASTTGTLLFNGKMSFSLMVRRNPRSVAKAYGLVCGRMGCQHAHTHTLVMTRPFAWSSKRLLVSKTHALDNTPRGSMMWLVVGDTQSQLHHCIAWIFWFGDWFNFSCLFFKNVWL